MATHPASQLTNYLERLARFLTDNKPSYVKKYNVTVSTFKNGEDTHTIKLSIGLDIKESDLKALDTAGLIEDEY